MKHVLLCAALALGTMLTTSCNEEKKLAQEVTGVWAGTTETLNDPSVVSATILETFDFQAAVTDATKHFSGPVTITGMCSATTQMVGDSSIYQPVSVTFAAETTVSGTWTVIDDDEIALNLDMATLNVAVDPSAVTVSNNLLTGVDTPQTSQVSPAAIANITGGLRTALTQRYAMLRHLDDVKVKGPLMKYEIDHRDFTMTRQTPQQ